MSYPVMPLGFLGSQGDQDTYRIDRSLRFNSADSAYLNRTPASAGNRKTWTWSGWVKRSALSSLQYFFGAGTGSNDATFAFYSDDTFVCFLNDGTGATGLRTSSVYRDTSSWYHIVVSLDTTQSTSTNRQKIYINGSEVTAFGTASYPNQNTDWPINNTNAHDIGRARGGSYFNGYLTEINFIDGQALTPSSFGETDAITGRWKAKAYSGTYGTNGFYLKFADNSGTTATTLGKDSSGNGNNWTPNNFSVTAGAGNDSLVDSPTNYGTDTGVGGEVRGNYCTLNPLSNNGGTMLDGNLDFYGPSAWRFAGGTIAVSSGKWYIEATHFGASVGNTEGNVYSFIGFIRPSTAVAAGISHTSYTSSVIGIGDSGWAYNFAAGSSATTGFGSGDVASVSIDFTTGSYNIRKNNTSVASGTMAFTGELIPCIFSYASTYRWQPNFGQRPFAYTAPSGFKALCTTNLPTPTIQKPSSYMDVVLRNGTGTTGGTISSLAFSPDFLWTKTRSSVGAHTLHNSLIGSTKYLSSNTTGSEITDANYIVSFNSNGYTIGSSDWPVGTTVVDWAWDEASIAGMDIVSYTGNGATQTISHSLGVTPKMIIAKARSTISDWPVYHSSSNASPQNGGLNLNKTDAFTATSSLWNNTSPTSSGFTVGTGLSSNAATYIAYLFAEVEGFSKFGSYTGNGSADGPFVWCGFRPRWVMIKKTTDTLNADWRISDSARSQSNAIEAGLYANLSLAEDTLAHIDYCSNGFKLRTTGNGWNGSGSTYIFAAFAESPFKYARAR